MKKNNISNNEKIEALVEFAGKEIMKDEFVLATVVNHNEQPIVMSTSADGSMHKLAISEGVFLEMPSKMIPYLSFALAKMYEKSLNLVHDGDSKKINAHLDIVKKEISDIDFFNIKNEENNEDVKCTCGDKSCPDYEEKDEKVIDDEEEDSVEDIEKSLRDLGESISEKIKKGEINEEDEEEIKEALMNIVENQKESLQDIRDSLSALEKGNPTQASVEAIKEKLDAIRDNHQKELSGYIKDIEQKVNGKVNKAKKEINLESIKEVFLKYGPQAAKEELRKIPAEKRQEIAMQAIAFIQSKK